MTLTLQVPGDGNTLHRAIVEAATSASTGFAAFAFATATGLDTFFAEPRVNRLLRAGTFELVVGLDAITDTSAIAAIKTFQSSHGAANIKLFYNPKGGVLYHPKTIFFRTSAGATCITGSGNMTLGGLRNNWEAFWTAHLSPINATAVELEWQKWAGSHADHLLSPDDPRVAAQASLNARTRAKIQAAVAETDVEALSALEQDNAETLSFNPFLIAEVPKNRPGQADVGIGTYQNFFGVTLGQPRDVTFYQVRPDGSMAPPEHRHAVAARSGNYRFEVDALKGLKYPDANTLILIFERMSKNEYRYILLQPEQEGHKQVQSFLDENYMAIGKSKSRPVVTRADVQAAWPENPLLLH